MIKDERSDDEDVRSLIKFRRRYGLSQEKAARLMGISWATVNRWEMGKHRLSDLARGAIKAMIRDYKDRA